MGLAFAHQVRDGSGEDEDFQRSAAALLVNALEEILSHDTPERLRQRRANLVLLLGREHVDDAVHCLRGALCVQRAKDKMPSACRSDGQLDRFKIAQFSNEDDVWIFAQRPFKWGQMATLE